MFYANVNFLNQIINKFYLLVDTGQKYKNSNNITMNLRDKMSLLCLKCIFGIKSLMLNLRPF